MCVYARKRCFLRETGQKKKYYGQYEKGGTRREFLQAGGRDLKKDRKEFDKDMEWILKVIMIGAIIYL